MQSNFFHNLQLAWQFVRMLNPWVLPDFLWTNKGELRPLDSVLKVNVSFDFIFKENIPVIRCDMFFEAITSVILIYQSF